MSDQRKVVFQGEVGANSHMACNAVYPEYQAIPCATFEDCFHAIETGEAELGMIPIENSVAGRVADIHHLLPRSNLHIIGEYFMPIRFQLMGIKGTKLEELKSVQSHIMGLGQCRNFIRDHNLKPIIGADTAGSARQVVEGGDKTIGAFAPELAADVYGLDILARDCEDAAHNTTRFVILSREKKQTANTGQPIITTFIFRVRNVSAALYKGLGGFATNNVNMTKLESYQLEGQFFASMFYADIEGHPEEPNVALALEELAFYSTELNILGVYNASPFREKIREPEANRALRPTPGK
ncbi:prephenate dehydratase [Pseudovibrio ascidiaceicola]|jgi:prephenate dehydratase|uniref:prephenate dehydratase n=2 Tax=Pseudovibrio TaxID=258255 RepID=A0A1I3VNJ2_9HYPH|nr:MULTISPECIES: prephenate dehydratase [Pseudovibrio]KZK87269.1 P-protein [Pseudovibrio sp. Ad13]KZK89089.1 P-protein [Pseudovibrio sp. Ad5]KZL12332.1 P-protein [Pseudovibrio sp. Ad14]KZL16440.1 P-protein [Pseudovibrio sp. Ad26]KZL20051.1 P-protein [Pseudovibrio sp. WM33]